MLLRPEPARGGTGSGITGVDSGRILRFSYGSGSVPESKICEKLNPDPESLFHFGSSRSLCGHFLGITMGKLW